MAFKDDLLGDTGDEMPLEEIPALVDLGLRNCSSAPPRKRNLRTRFERLGDEETEADVVLAVVVVGEVGSSSSALSMSAAMSSK